jgi:hypothetical protein
MNDSWTTMAMTTAMMMQNRRPSEEVSHSDIAALLKGRKYTEDGFEMDAPLPPHDPAELKELQDFCAKYGIVGVGASSKDSPSVILRKLKAKMGIVEQTAKKGLLHG